MPRLQLGIQCSQLCDADLLSKSDPICILYDQISFDNENHWREIGRTEKVKNSLSPSWTTLFSVDYTPDSMQEVKFEVYDWDANKRDPKDQDFLGRSQTTLDAIVNNGHYFAAVLKDAPKCQGSKIFVVAEDISDIDDVGACNIQFAAANLDNKDFLSKSDPFFELSKVTPNGKFVSTYRSEVVKNNLDPTWNKFSISVLNLCSNDFDRPLQVDIYDFDKDGSHDLIGTCKLTLSDLTKGPDQRYPCINPKKLGKKKYQHSGKLLIKEITMTHYDL